MPGIVLRLGYRAIKTKIPAFWCSILCGHKVWTKYPSEVFSICCGSSMSPRVLVLESWSSVWGGGETFKRQGLREVLRSLGVCPWEELRELSWESVSSSKRVVIKPVIKPNHTQSF
jgi:hypothetical protein